MTSTIRLCKCFHTVQKLHPSRLLVARSHVNHNVSNTLRRLSSIDQLSSDSTTSSELLPCTLSPIAHTRLPTLSSCTVRSYSTKVSMKKKSSESANGVPPNSKTESKDPYPIRHSRLDQIARSPSGWVPPASSQLPPDDNLHPFWVQRTFKSNVPVYFKYTNKGTVAVTAIHKVFGDLDEFAKCLEWKFGENTVVRKDYIGMKVWMSGNHEDAVKLWLMQLGF